MRRLPPLNAVRVFVAAGRNLSFNGAAEELGITPSAVSHQIRQLEERLGVKLFRRLNRRVVLTGEGQAYLPPLRSALEQIATATERVSATTGGQLTMSLMPTFAIRWLVPRLSRFQAAHPDIEVRLSTSVELVEFDKADIDLGIRYGNGDWPGLHTEKIMSEALYPACSPALLAGPEPLREPADLARFTLIQVIPRIDEWRMWLTAAGVEGVDPERGPKFATTALALEAAIGGLGLVIADRPMIAEDVARGRLVQPFDVELPSDSAYYLVYPEASAGHPRIVAFRDWIMAEAAAEAAAAGD